MESGFNELSVIGTVEKIPQINITKEKQLVVNLSIGSPVWTKERTFTLWVEVALWGRAAEFTRDHIGRGDLVHVVGTLLPDKETGNPRIFQRRNGTYATRLEIKGRLITLLNVSPNSSYSQETTENSEFDDEVNNLF